MKKELELNKIIFMKNDDLESIKEDFKGVPYKKGRFCGEFDSRSKKRKTKISNILGFIKKSIKKEKRIKETSSLIIKKGILPKSKTDFIIWLGHASFLIQLDGKRILTDPCFGPIPLKKRYSFAPYNIKEVGTVDYLLVSHGHHDHLDIKTLKAAGQNIKEALVPLKMSPLIKKANRDIKVQEAGWYQKFNTEKVEIFLLPAHHWHRRGVFDFNRVLWGSFIIKSENRTIYFAGDSGYNVHFKEIGRIFDIDYAIIPINPPYAISGSHMSHKECIEAINDLNAKKYIPMHYGTFKFNLESSHELISWFESLEKSDKIKGDILINNIGEMIEV